jgi:hypothetical protein
MNAPNDNTAAKGLRGWWASPPRTGMQRLIVPYEYRHLRFFGAARIAGGSVAAAAGVICLAYGVYGWAAFFLLLGALNLALIIHADGERSWAGGKAAGLAMILGRGYDGAPAGGPVAGGSMCPGGFLWGRWDGVRAGQGACGRAVTRSQAVMMALAQGQVAAIFSRRRRPLRVRRAAVWNRR